MLEIIATARLMTVPMAPSLAQVRGVNWMQVCQDFEEYNAEPCGTLVTSDNKLTTEGIHIFR